MLLTVTGDNVIQIVEEGEGKWKLSRVLACGVELTGFDGENHLYILIQSWQSGDYHVTVCHCIVDGSTEVRQAQVKEVKLTSWVNTLIAQTSPHKL